MQIKKSQPQSRQCFRAKTALALEEKLDTLNFMKIKDLCSLKHSNTPFGIQNKPNGLGFRCFNCSKFLYYQPSAYAADRQMKTQEEGYIKHACKSNRNAFFRKKKSWILLDVPHQANLHFVIRSVSFRGHDVLLTLFQV